MIPLIFSYYEIALRAVVGQKIRPTTVEMVLKSNGKLAIGAIPVFSLGSALNAVQDNAPSQHVAISPNDSLSLQSYQSILNTLPWINVTNQFLKR